MATRSLANLGTEVYATPLPEVQRSKPRRGAPASVTLMRHAQSKYNQMRAVLAQEPVYVGFQKSFDATYYPKDRIPGDKMPHKNMDLDVVNGRWPTEDLVQQARRAYDVVRDYMGDVNDAMTPITTLGKVQSEEVGTNVADIIPVPDYMYVSPYKRTRQTRRRLVKNAPASWGSVPVRKYKSLREQEHGGRTTLIDWRIDHVLRPFDMLDWVKQGDYHYRFNGGENVFDVLDRCSRFVKRLYSKHIDQHIFVVTHHLYILGILSEILHWEEEDFGYWDECKKPINCGLTVLRKGEDGELRLADDDYNIQLYKTMAV